MERIAKRIDRSLEQVPAACASPSLNGILMSGRVRIADTQNDTNVAADLAVRVVVPEEMWLSYHQGKQVMETKQEVKSLKKALRALTFLNVHGESTVTEVSGAIGVPRTTAHRLLETLASAGYVEKQAHSALYRLTSLVQQLSSGFGDSELVVEIAKPMVQDIGAKIGWPLALATPRGKNMVVRVTTDYDTSLVIDRFVIGFLTPILHAPSGFCYLAFCDETVRHALISEAERAESKPEVLRNGTARLDYLLEQVRTLGFCNMLYPEYSEGGLAVPLLIDNTAVGGIVMRYMKATQKPQKVEEEFAPILRQLAADIAAAYRERNARARKPVSEGTFLPQAGDSAARKRRRASSAADAHQTA